jgi:viologen exporter family transport system permease protein
MWKILSALFKVNLQMTLAYRTDTWVSALISLMWLGWELLSLQIIFSNTTTLNGWGPGELIALLGVFRLVNTLLAAVIWPATEKFNTSVRDGSLDYTLLQPANSLFLVSFSRIVIWRIWDLALGVALIVIGIHISGAGFAAAGASGVASLISFIVLGISGTLVIYSLWVVMIALTFWFVKFDNNVTILQALLDAGRYPATVYPPWLRMIVTFIVPIAVATTVPMQALRGDLTLWQIWLFLSIGVISFLVATQAWKSGVRHYSGASS